jgi:hypothetical protein
MNLRSILTKSRQFNVPTFHTNLAQVEAVSQLASFVEGNRQ